MGCEVTSVTLREEHRLRAFYSGVMWKGFDLQKMEVIGQGKS
jgi:hypothetical protein